MISGLRMLPRVQAERQRRRDDGDPFADQYMDCTSCKAQPDYAGAIAPEWRCGWLREEEWREGMAPHQEDVCPGYTTGLSEVIETARLYQWREKGSLAAICELPLPPPAALCVDVMSGAARETEDEALRRARDEAKRGARHGAG